MSDQDRPAIRVLLADGQSLFREAMKVVLETQADFQVVAEAADGMHAVAEAERIEPDLALVDSELPNGDGIRTTRMIADRTPTCRILFMSQHEDDRGLISSLEAGATGFVTKGSPIGELMEVARRVHRGETTIPPQMLGTLLASLIKSKREHDDALRRLAKLTRREREVLALLAQGADNEGIAQPLVISPETARTHVQNVLGKLGVHSRLEAAAFVIQNGLVDELVGVGA
ncbi:MAG TPA: response regulator transcription factor [Actinomycetota bacterium]|nr:response regulator transcription factor [Actinomycetota bacterium]